MSIKAQKPIILLTGNIDFAQAEWNALSDIATLEVTINLSSNHLVVDCI